MPDLHDFYIWLLLQGTPIAVFYTEVLCCEEREKKKETKKQKQKSISVERQPSTVLRMSEVEFTRQRR